MAWMVAMMMAGSTSYAADGPTDDAKSREISQAFFAPLESERPSFAKPPVTSPMPSLPGEAVPELLPAKVKVERHRSRALLLGALGAEVAAGALLGGAAATRTSYLDPSNDPGRGLYRSNRVLGHAGYASAVAGGALFLGSISMWEW